MEGIAWDDKTDYFEMLAPYLEKHNISLEIFERPERFLDELINPAKKWDLVLLDLFDSVQSEEGEEEAVGAKLAREIHDRHHGKLPIYLITSRIHAVNHQDLGLPHSVVVKSKDLKPAWMAQDIVEELIRSGIFVDRRKIFLVYGHERTSDGVIEKVESYLDSAGLNVVKITPETLLTNVNQGLLSEMNSSGAFIALCTPDDAHADNKCYPRLNVILEIGLAMGLSRGIERLIILQKWGPTKANKAQLPSDLDGMLTIRFNEIDELFPPLKERLIELRIKI